MIVTQVCVLGGAGFVGRHVCHQLVERGYRVRVPSHDRERSRALIVLPTVEVMTANVHDPDTLKTLFRGCDAVVNLVGVLHGGRREASFQSAHVELARKVVEACRAQGVRRLIHMSALGADPNGPSAYQRTKGEAERIVRESGLDFTIFRPSVIFGREDRFLNLFAQLQRVLPVVVLGSPNARFQPVHVDDVARAFAQSMTRPESFGATYDLAGPRVYTLRELVAFAGEASGHPRRIIGLSRGLSFLQAALMELLPMKLLTRDNVRSMSVDNVSSAPFPFGNTPADLEAAAPTWLAQRTPRTRYQVFRDRSRRGR